MKKLFLENGFKIVYDQDLGEPIADGFYFTISYPGMTGSELVKKTFCILASVPLPFPTQEVKNKV